MDLRKELLVSAANRPAYQLNVRSLLGSAAGVGSQYALTGGRLGAPELQGQLSGGQFCGANFGTRLRPATRIFLQCRHSFFANTQKRPLDRRKSFIYSDQHYVLGIWRTKIDGGVYRARFLLSHCFSTPSAIGPLNAVTL